MKLSKKQERHRRLLPDGIPKYIRIYDNGGRDADRFCRKCLEFTEERDRPEGQNEYCSTCGGKLLPSKRGTIDQYTVVFSGNYKGRDGLCRYLAMNRAPFHPQGFGQHGEHYQVVDAPSGFTPKVGDLTHLGRRVTWDQLNDDCRRAVMQDYCSYWDLEYPWRYYRSYDESRTRDPAWDEDSGKTNYKLRRGDRVALNTPTVGEGGGRGVFGALIPRGAVGEVVHARSVRVTRKRVTGWSQYFANVDFTAPNGDVFRARVPHSAIVRLGPRK